MGTMGLQQFEERLERLVEGTLAKPFRSNLQPVEIGRRLTREMDLHRRVGVRDLIAPNAFAVTLAPADVERFSNFIDALSRELSDAAREHAKMRVISFVGPVEVEVFEGSTLKAGRFTVEAEVREDEDGGFLAELVLTDGRRVGIGTEPLVIGRLPECGVVLAGLQREPPACRVAPGRRQRRADRSRVDQRDTGERGARPRAVLVSGDEVSVGSTRLIFEMT